MIAVAQPLASRVLGAGDEPALALHCTMAFSGAWSGLAKALPQMRITAPDALNHGGSPDWDGQGDFFARIMGASLPFLDRPMHVIGHSFGAMTALYLALERPHLVRTLTLIEPVFFCIAAQDAPDLLAAHNDEALEYFTALQRGDYMLSARIFNRMWADTGTPRWPDIPEPVRAAMARGVQIVPHCSAPIFEDTAGLLQPDRLGALSAPTLILRGDATHPVMPVVNDGLARRMVDATSAVIAGAGHMVAITHPKETARAMAERFGW